MMLISFKLLGVLSLVLFLSILMLGCINPPEPIDRILLVTAPDDQSVPPSAALSISEKDPFPTFVHEFPLEAKLYVGIRISTDFKEDVTFTKFAIFNPADSTEYEVGNSEELGPYEPGQIPLLNLYAPWPLPDENGRYEFRIYLDDKIVSKALFDILD